VVAQRFALSVSDAYFDR